MTDRDKVTRAFLSLIDTLEQLRGPGGCPWDRAQRPRDLRSSAIEETYELIDAVTHETPEAILDELGDVLLQVMFLSMIYQEEGQFDLGDVVVHLREKLILRHPHVFGDERAETPEEVLRNWETWKTRERGETQPRRSRFESISHSLPALAEAWMIQRKAAQVHFDWPDTAGVFEKIREEIQEIQDASNSCEPGRIEDEIGDLLFAVVNLARKYHVHPEIALKQANRKFIQRFTYVEKELQRRGQDLAAVDSATLDHLWEESKVKEI